MATQAAPTTYLSLGAVLTVLVYLTLWREMATTNAAQFFPRSFSALAFVASRVLAVIFTASVIEAHMPPPLIYILLNFLCLFLAAQCIPAELVSGGDQADGHDTQRARTPSPDNVSALRYQTAVFGLVGALVYIIVPTTSKLSFSFAGLINAVLVAATIRVTVYLISVVRNANSEMRMLLMTLVLSLGVSWMLVVAASFFQGEVSSVLLQVSRGSDILSLVAGLLSLQSNYLLVGFYHKNRADTKHEEAEKAKAELSLMNRVASDIYEDSSSMIQRHQDHSRDLMRRIDSLEKILRIGVEIQQHNDQRKLLQMVVELISDNIGFRTVILRLLNQRTQSFETKAFVGVNDDAQDALMNYRLTMSEYEEMVEPRFRISQSYLLQKTSPMENGNDTEGSGETVLVSDQWSEVDRVIIPLVEEAGNKTVGYISVEEPGDSDMSVVDTIENLETVATLAVTAIRNTSHSREVADKNEKLKIYAEKLASLNKMKSNFVATISHEFRTPLTSIKAYCETLLNNADNVDRNILKEFLVVIDEESDRLMTLIEDILDFSQMESGTVKFERAPCNVREIVAEASKELEKNFARKDITMHVEIPSGEVNVRAERELMKQLLVNLLHNASKFTPDNGNVWVRLEDETVSARIVVEDDGIGIPEDQIDKVFDHFHQGDNTTTRKYGGTGIGLAICKNIVDWHDGKIWVESVPGRGARFVVVIPKKQVIVRSHVLHVEGTMRRYEVERYLELIIEMVAELLSVRKASIMLVDKETQELRIECAIGLDEEVVEHARAKAGEGIAGRVLQEARSYLVEDIESDKRVGMRNNDYLYDSSSFLSVPIIKDGEVLGVVNVADPATRPVFVPNDQCLLELFAGRIALALGRLYDFAARAIEFESVRDTFRSMLDAKRYVNDQSTEALSEVLKEVGKRLGMTNEESATLRYVFHVYDLGLAKLGYNIVKQPRSLTKADRKQVERHTVLGTEMLKPIETVPGVRDAVLYHHENFDGTGYPGKLSGEEIPLEARIIRIFDTFRALISHRPYQKQYTVPEALEVLRHRSGTFFDPQVVEVFDLVVTELVDKFQQKAVSAEEVAAPESQLQ